MILAHAASVLSFILWVAATLSGVTLLRRGFNLWIGEDDKEARAGCCVMLVGLACLGAGVVPVFYPTWLNQLFGLDVSAQVVRRSGYITIALGCMGFIGRSIWLVVKGRRPPEKILADMLLLSGVLYITFVAMS